MTDVSLSHLQLRASAVWRGRGRPVAVAEYSACRRGNAVDLTVLDSRSRTAFFSGLGALTRTAQGKRVVNQLKAGYL